MHSAQHLKNCKILCSQTRVAQFITVPVPVVQDINQDLVQPGFGSDEQTSKPQCSHDADTIIQTQSVSRDSESSNRQKLQPPINAHVYNDAVTKAEVLWALRIVTKHQSYRSCDELKDIFQCMFPDSKIAQKFTLGAAKVAYMIVYGLAPYFRTALIDTVSKCYVFVVCFDEALNKISQRGQMDLVVRFWDSCQGVVSTRYLTSVFLGHATAKDLEIKLREGLSGLSEKNIIQVSMDGPNVNWKMLENLKDSRDACDRELIDIGSCGLHVLHGNRPHDVWLES